MKYFFSFIHTHTQGHTSSQCGMKRYRSLSSTNGTDDRNVSLQLTYMIYSYNNNITKF